MQGNFGGLAAADALCQAEGTTNFGAGTYMAWLSDDSATAADRLNHSEVSYRLPSGTTVADDWSDLTDGSLDSPINQTATGASATGYVWTGTVHNGNGSLSPCLNWTSNSGSEFGPVGDTSAVDSTWSFYSAVLCNGSHSLYCLEQ
jgi:hypothetical protein